METPQTCDTHTISIEKSELHDGSWLLGQKYIVGHHAGPTLGSFEAVFFWDIKSNQFGPPVLQNTPRFSNANLPHHESQFWAKFARRFGRFSSSPTTQLGKNSRKTEHIILSSCLMKKKLEEYAKEVAIMTSDMCSTFVSTMEKIQRRCLTDVAGVKPLQLLHESRRKKMKQKMELRMDILEQRFDLDEINSFFEAENKSFWQDFGLQVDILILHEKRKFCYSRSKRRHQKMVECELPISALCLRVQRIPAQTQTADLVEPCDPAGACVEDNHTEFFQGMSNAILSFLDVFEINFEIPEEPEIQIPDPPEIMTVLPPVPSTPRSRKASISSKRLSDTSISRLEDTDSIVERISVPSSRKNSFAGRSYDSLPPMPLSTISDYCDYDADDDDNNLSRHVVAALGRGRSLSTSSSRVSSPQSTSPFSDNNIISV